MLVTSDRISGRRLVQVRKHLRTGSCVRIAAGRSLVAVPAGAQFFCMLQPYTASSDLVFRKENLHQRFGRRPIAILLLPLWRFHRVLTSVQDYVRFSLKIKLGRQKLY
jgi:hypothetical protein